MTLELADARVFSMHVHLVFVTKYRRRVFDNAAIDRLESCSPRSALTLKQSYKRWMERLIMFTAGELPAKVAVSALVNSLNPGHQSGVLRKTARHAAKFITKGMLVAIYFVELAALR